jgi:hypothetical protein
MPFDLNQLHVNFSQHLILWPIFSPTTTYTVQKYTQVERWKRKRQKRAIGQKIYKYNKNFTRPHCYRNNYQLIYTIKPIIWFSIFFFDVIAIVHRGQLEIESVKSVGKNQTYQQLLSLHFFSQFCKFLQKSNLSYINPWLFPI